MRHISEIKIGVFAITGLILLVFGWAFLREFSVQVQQKFTVVYDDVVGLTKGSFVRINGLRVGRVDKLTLDTENNKVLIDARIQIPKVNIPKDSKVYIRTSGYVGDKYLDIVLGMSKVYIMDGEVVLGEPAFDAFQSLEKVGQILNQIDSKTVGQNIQDVTKNANIAVKKVATASDEVSMALNQKFLLPKLLFGKLKTKREKT
ncbi:MAG: MCE family protein [Candidatus Melainabacteria bacterium]|nr:MCE family protein [Candidatus Melainabacteria bacterium]